MSGGVLPIVLDGALRGDGRIDLLALGPAVLGGEGLFETLPVRGGRPLFLSRHLRRLASAALALGLGPIPGDETWRNDIRLLVAAAGIEDLAVRFVVLSDGERVRRFVGATGLPPDAGQPVRLGLADPEVNGARVLAAWKTLNYLQSRRAHALGAARGLDEVVFTLPDGTVLEGTRSSVFVVRDGVLWTPPLSLPILPGVTRELVLEVAAEAGISSQERAFALDALRRADEVFITASVRGLRSVRSFESMPLTNPEGGPITRMLLTAFAARVDREG